MEHNFARAHTIENLGRQKLRMVAAALLCVAVIGACTSQTKINTSDGYVHIEWPSLTDDKGNGLKAATWFVDSEFQGETNLATDITIISEKSSTTNQVLIYKNTEDRYPSARMTTESYYNK